ncbi:MAG: type I DNA topoisomerase [Polyangiales bacterium]
MSKALVIVESPAKARTIKGFLGSDYIVESSIGHIRDLPRRASEVPAEHKKKSWARLGVDVEGGFIPLYIVDPEKREHIRALKSKLKEVDELLLATDEDREGESIAWHLYEVLKPKVPVKRMVFHEITRPAIAKAIAAPRHIDRHLVDAQEARRILDRLYGYEVSPVLWKKVMPRLSAGRVQSVATRIIVARERQRIDFRAAHYWDIDGHFDKEAGTQTAPFLAQLAEVDGSRVAAGRDFDEQGKLKKQGVVIIDEKAATALAAELPHGRFHVAAVDKKPLRRIPPAPFMTSTLQQEAGRKLRFGAQRTMRAAQRLYEGGYITYMRTDSTTLSATALTATRAQIQKLYGANYVPDAPRVYKRKVKNAQEAHEAIRPAGDNFRSIDAVGREVGPDEARLYELIWKRTIASQMPDARGHSVQVRIAGKTPSGKGVTFAVNGITITFPGFQRAYVEGSDDPEAELESKERPIPPVAPGDTLRGLTFQAKDHQTQPPARFTEASLVRRLEELGVGRPSTYASIMGTIQDRGYVWKKGNALVPSYTAFVVVTLLERHFPRLVDYAFTARMEDDLDAIARGDDESGPWLHRFYFGNPDAPGPAPQQTEASEDGGASTNAVQPAHGFDIGLQRLVESQLASIDARAINTVHLGHDEAGEAVVVRVGRYGPYVQRGDDKVSLTDNTLPDELTAEVALELLQAPSGDRVLGPDPTSGKDIVLKNGRFGAYVQVGEAVEGEERPKTATLLRSQEASTLTLAEALQLLTLPRLVGTCSETGEDILAHNGRYGPYLTRGKDNRSLNEEGQLFTVTVSEAQALFKEPKRGRKQAAAAAPLRELGPDPVSGETITLRKGRFGPYVTDGETNASLRSGDDPDSLTPERAQELLQLRRERGPAKGKGRKAGKSTKATKSSKATKKTTKAAKSSKATKKTTKAAKKTTKRATPNQP